MDPNVLIASLVERLSGRSVTNDQELWELIADEYLRLTGSALERENPYHIALAASAYRTLRPEH